MIFLLFLKNSKFVSYLLVFLKLINKFKMFKKAIFILILVKFEIIIYSHKFIFLNYFK